MQSPTTTHWLSVKRILRYLRGTMQDGIKLQACDHLQIQAYTDADYASTPDDRHSSSGYCLYMGENLVSWYALLNKRWFLGVLLNLSIEISLLQQLKLCGLCFSCKSCVLLNNILQYFGMTMLVQVIWPLIPFSMLGPSI